MSLNLQLLRRFSTSLLPFSLSRVSLGVLPFYSSSSSSSLSSFTSTRSPLLVSLQNFSTQDNVPDGSSKSSDPTPPPSTNNSTSTSPTTNTTSNKSTKTDPKLALKPNQIVAELDRFIVGQATAKRAVAIALRNRWRFNQLSEQFRQEVVPKNILMIGPTGVGKTEIARRLAKLSSAPFLKVEATKFTELGFVGRDVDSIIQDLMETGLQQVKERSKARFQAEADKMAEEKILDILMGEDGRNSSRQKFRELLNEGKLDERKIEVETKDPVKLDPRAVPLQPHGGDLFKLFVTHSVPSSTTKKRMTVGEARVVLKEREIESLQNNEALIKEAKELVENNGIVFIDEIDKICVPKDEIRTSSDASNEGVQRDLLPLIEGTIVQTKYGNVNTAKILFIASGAFHSTKPSDLLAELQGRLPIRVELKGLSEADLYRILTEPEYNLIKQQVELLKTESISLHFKEEAIKEIARIAAEANTMIENIGARRLHTVIERVIEEISFACGKPEQNKPAENQQSSSTTPITTTSTSTPSTPSTETISTVSETPSTQAASETPAITTPEQTVSSSPIEIIIDAAWVKEKIGDLLKKTDLSRFIL